MLMNDWLPPPADLKLQPNEVHVWQADLQSFSSALPAILYLLSPDEQARANRFYFQKDRDRFTLARGILRLILGRYLDRSAESLQFRSTKTGKPFLSNADLPSGQKLCFNVSHSHQMALYALAWNREVGIDVEQINPDRDLEAIADRFFSAAENRALMQLSPDVKPQGFFNCWTRKEAFLKAIGTGLTQPLDQFTVSLTPGEPAQLLQTAWDENDIDRWSLYSLEVGTEYAAALAVQGIGCQLQSWQFEVLPGRTSR